MTATELAIVPPTDTLSFSLTEEAVVVNDTVRIVVRVHAQKALDGTEAALQADIRQAVRSFVDAPDWMLSAMRRDTQPTGLETVTLTASVVVPDTENHALKDRAEKASRPGLTLSNPVADTSIPTAVLQAAERRLRKTLLQRAMDEAVELSGPCPGLVLHSIQFGALAPLREPPTERAAVSRAPAGPASPGDGDVTANVARTSMSAAVTLRRVAP